MLLASVDYYRPGTLAEATNALSGSEDARALAGGQSLVSLLKLRAAQVDLLVDISRLEELRSVTENDDGSVTIGSCVTYDELEHHDQLGSTHPSIGKVAGGTVDQQIRNRGTIGGNLCHNDPINNFPVLAVALDATMHAVSTTAQRDIPATGFFTAAFSNALEPEELLTGITFPALEEGFRVGWSEIEIGEAASRAVAVVRTENGSIAEARMTLGCLPVPTLRPDTAAQLASVGSSESEIAEAVAAVADGIDFFPDDADASSDYRRAMAPVVARRAVLDALGDNDG
jgi:carbon-monoxide dehydrogenase medium subunit